MNWPLTQGEVHNRLEKQVHIAYLCVGGVFFAFLNFTVEEIKLGCLLEMSFFIEIGCCSISFFLALFTTRSLPLTRLRLQRS